jgi:hypothetical protein
MPKGYLIGVDLPRRVKGKKLADIVEEIARQIDPAKYIVYRENVVYPRPFSKVSDEEYQRIMSSHSFWPSDERCSIELIKPYKTLVREGRIVWHSSLGDILFQVAISDLNGVQNGLEVFVYDGTPQWVVDDFIKKVHNALKE